MQTDFESKQSIEVLWGGEATETVFEIGLKCTAPSFAGYFDSRVGGEPPSGPEFDVTTIEVVVPRVNPTEYDHPVLSVISLEYDQFIAVVGREIGKKIIDRAMNDAAEKGDF